MGSIEQPKIDITGTLNVSKLMKGGKEVATVEDLNSIDSGEYTKNELILMKLFPVGTIYLTSENINPQTSIGVGNWIFYKNYYNMYGWCRIK